MSLIKKKEPSALNKNTGPNQTNDNNTMQQSIPIKRMPCSINKKLVNKATQKEVARYNNLFEPLELTAKELASYIKNNGYAYNTVYKGIRKAENFIRAGFVSLDFDSGFTLESAKNHPFIKQYASFIYTTPSHQKGNKGDRFRVVFELSRIIYDAKEFIKLLKGLLEKFLQADQSCKDPTRIFFGSLDCELTMLENILPDEMIKELIELGSEKKCKRKNNYKKQSHRKDDPTLDQIREMLSYIDPMPGYEIWRDLIWAVKSWGYLNNISDEVIKELIEEWSPDYKTGGKAIDSLLENYEHGRMSIGTLVHHAHQNGYKPPQSKYPSTSGQVAMQDLFFETSSYASFGDNLYHYSNGYFKLIPEEVLRKKISDYFDTYITNSEEGTTGYASTNAIESALKYVKTRYFRDPDTANPPGVNLRNGYLKLSYDHLGNPIFKFLDHSPEYFFTYKADFDFNPKADSSIFDEALDNILDSDQQKILLRSLAGAFDLEKVRIKQGRAVRIQLLYGDGSNGKDTVREWVCKLYKNLSMTFIGLQAFRNADNGRLFGVLGLATSRINWSSENKAISLDQCQSLKNCATGDPLEVEEKFKQGFAITPKSVMFFNINQIPRLEAQQEAIATRYGVLHFKNTFKSKPDPENPREKKADPRLKEDTKFIIENIMPAFLNRLVKEFKELLKEGIDYSCNESLMQDIREDNDHFLEFVNQSGLVECGIKDGLNASKIFARYQDYCLDYGLVDIDDRGNIIRYHDPSKYDRVVRNVRQITIRLKEVFPHLNKVRSGSKGRRLGLNFLVEQEDLSI